MNSKILLCFFLAVAVQHASSVSIFSRVASLLTPPPQQSVTCPSVPAGQCRNFTSDQVVKMDILGYIRTYTPKKWYVPYSSKSVLTSYANSLGGQRDRSAAELDQLCLRDEFIGVLCRSSGYQQEVDQVCAPQLSMKLAQMCCKGASKDSSSEESVLIRSYPASRLTILKSNSDQSEILVVRCVNGQDDFKVLSKRPTVSAAFEAQVNQTLRSLNFNLDNNSVGRQSYSNCGNSASTTTTSTTTTTTTTTEAPSTEAPATEAPSTEAPATEAPATEAPATEAPSTEAPAPTAEPSTEAPSTEAPSTEAPATEAPATEAPATEAPSTEAPATEAPSTEAPAPTAEPSTEASSSTAESATTEAALTAEA